LIQVALSYEVSDDAVEVAAMKEGAGAWTFVCTMGCDVIEPGPSLRVLPYDRSNEKPRRGKTGAAFRPTNTPFYVDDGRTVGASSFSRQGSPRSFSYATA
jgi:hypothetical protein